MKNQEYNLAGKTIVVDSVKQLKGASRSTIKSEYIRQVAKTAQADVKAGSEYYIQPSETMIQRDDTSRESQSITLAAVIRQYQNPNPKFEINGLPRMCAYKTGDTKADLIEDLEDLIENETPFTPSYSGTNNWSRGGSLFEVGDTVSVVYFCSDNTYVTAIMGVTAVGSSTVTGVVSSYKECAQGFDDRDTNNVILYIPRKEAVPLDIVLYDGTDVKDTLRLEVQNVTRHRRTFGVSETQKGSTYTEEGTEKNYIEGDSYVEVSVSGDTKTAVVKFRYQDDWWDIEQFRNYVRYDEILTDSLPDVFSIYQGENHVQASGYDWFKQIIAEHISAVYYFVGGAIYGYGQNGQVDMTQPVGERATGDAFIIDKDGIMEISSGHARNLNVRGTLNLYADNGTDAGAEILHPALTTVKGMPGDSTGKTADTPTRWKVKELTDKITTANNPVSVSGSYGEESASKLLKLTDFNSLKGNCIGTIYTTASSAGITLDKVIYGNGVYVGFYTTGNVVHPEGHIYTSTDRQNWTERLGGTDAYATYNSGNFYNGYFYAYFGGTNTPGGVGFYKSLDGINWTFITVFHSSSGRGVRNMVMGRGFVFFYYTVGSTIYRCTDTFTNLQTMSSDTIMGVFSDVDNCFYTAKSDGIYSSSDSLTWTLVGDLPPRMSSSSSFGISVANGVLFFSEEAYYSYYSYNRGQTWTKVLSSYHTVRAAIVVGNKLITNPQGTSRWRADLNYSLQGLFPEDVGKYFYYSNSWKELVPDTITDTHALFTSGIVFDSDNYINYRLLSNFIGYTSYTYVDPDDQQTKTQSIELGIAYRVNSIGFKINNTPLLAVFFIRNSSTSITIVCTNGQSYTFTSGNYYYVEGSIAIADTAAGVEMMGNYPKEDMAYDTGHPGKSWLNGYISNIVSTSTLASKTGVTPYERKALDILNATEIVRFRYKADPKGIPHIGFVADYTDSDLAGEKHNSFISNHVIAVCVKAIQELSAEVERLKAERQNN